MRDLIEAVSKALSRSGSSTSDLRIAQTLSSHDRSDVAVMTTASRGRFIAKRFRLEDAELRFEAEMTALEALEVRPLAPVAHLLGSDREALLLVMEYVGDTSVEDLLQGRPREDAERALVGYASAIGRLHRTGSEALGAVRQLREGRGYPDNRFWPPFARDPQASGVATYTSASAELVTAEINAVVAETFAESHERRTLIQWERGLWRIRSEFALSDAAVQSGRFRHSSGRRANRGRLPTGGLSHFVRHVMRRDLECHPQRIGQLRGACAEERRDVGPKDVLPFG